MTTTDPLELDAIVVGPDDRLIIRIPSLELGDIDEDTRDEWSEQLDARLGEDRWLIVAGDVDVEVQPVAPARTEPHPIYGVLDDMFPDTGWPLDLVDTLVELAAHVIRLGLVAERDMLLVHAGPYTIPSGAGNLRTPYAARIYHGHPSAFVDHQAAVFAVAELNATLDRLGDDVREAIAAKVAR